MPKSKVAIIRCETYDEEVVYNAMNQGIDLLGGIEKFVGKKDSILVKPNYLLQEKVEKAATTHPSVIRGMLRILSEHGYSDVVFGDSPGHGSCESIAAKMGLGPETELYGAKVTPMNEDVLVKFPDGKVAKEFHFTKEVAEKDSIINLCKMKTHALERITGAVKNVYGFVCGYRKAQGHVKYPSAVVFADMLCDIHRCRTPKLNIMDGIVAMEGNGPSSGTPTKMNCLIFSTDPVAIDTVFAHIVDIDTSLVPTCWTGANAGIGTDKHENIEIVTMEDGEEKALTFDELFERFANPSFDVDRRGIKKNILSRLSDFAIKRMKKPVIDKNLCIKCGVCANTCPVKAVDFANGKEEPPVYDYLKCIRCYCCQEMCPRDAIFAKKMLEKK